MFLLSNNLLKFVQVMYIYQIAPVLSDQYTWAAGMV